MSLSSRHTARRVEYLRRSVAAILVIGITTFQFSPAQAAVAATELSLLLDSANNLVFRVASISTHGPYPRMTAKQFESPVQREARVARISLCPRRVLMYLGEQHTLSPLPLDTSGRAVHGVAFLYDSSISES